MFPLLLNHPPVVIPTFFFMVMFGSLAAIFYIYFQAKKQGLSQIAILDGGMLGLVFGMIGARLFHVFFEAWWFYKDDYWRILEVWRGGFVS